MSSHYYSIRYPPFTARKLKIANTLVVPKVKRKSYFHQAIMLCFAAAVVALTLRVRYSVVLCTVNYASVKGRVWILRVVFKITVSVQCQACNL